VINNKILKIHIIVEETGAGCHTGLSKSL